MNGINNHPGYCLESIPQPVDTLSTGAKAEWKRLAPTIFKMQTARPADLRSLELLCEILADITRTSHCTTMLKPERTAKSATQRKSRLKPLEGRHTGY